MEQKSIGFIHLWMHHVHHKKSDFQMKLFFNFDQRENLIVSRIKRYVIVHHRFKCDLLYSKTKNNVSGEITLNFNHQNVGVV